MKTAEMAVAAELLGASVYDCRLLAGGRNNRVYRVESSLGTFALKQYYRGGDWDRMAAESRFLRFCADTNIGGVPALVAEDAARGIALHGWLDGRLLIRSEIGDAEQTGAAIFLGELAAATRLVGLEAMSPARDACLCPADFFRSPRERMGQLARALGENTEKGDEWSAATVFFRERLLPMWKAVRDEALFMCRGMKPARQFAPYLLVVSPSDFGYHNMLRLAGGEVGFVDFEYAGLDSAVKAIADFVCQADYRVSDAGACIREMAGRICRKPGRTEELAELVENILPLNRIKFCCILLNEFKSSDARRREFSGAGGSSLRGQLDKTEKYFGSAFY